MCLAAAVLASSSSRGSPGYPAFGPALASCSNRAAAPDRRSGSEAVACCRCHRCHRCHRRGERACTAFESRRQPRSVKKKRETAMERTQEAVWSRALRAKSTPVAVQAWGGAESTAGPAAMARYFQDGETINIEINNSNLKKTHHRLFCPT